MSNNLKRFAAAAAAALVFVSAFAQEASSLAFRKPVTSPEISGDNIIFRFSAPKARQVQLSASWMGYDASKAGLQQGPDGIWSIELPLPGPELYTYTFVVDGVTTLDPANIFVQRDGSRYMNAFLVEGDFASLYKECPKPGDLELSWYYSAENDMIRRLYVYTPYGYNSYDKKTKYPVLYLLHGGGGDEDAWSTLGRTCQILDNLIAEGKTTPMVVVMPNGNPNQYAAQTLQVPVKAQVRKYSSNFDNYTSLVTDIIPFIEKNYNVRTDRKGRAVAGLSMGGGQSYYIAFRNVDKFSAVGIFSSGLIGSTATGGRPFNAEEQIPGMLSNPSGFNKFDVIYLSCGTEDNRIDGMQAFRDILNEKGYRGVTYESFPGAHEWKVWRRSLSSFVQLIFKK